MTRGLPDGGPNSSMSGGTLAQWFDVIVHRQELTPHSRLGPEAEEWLLAWQHGRNRQGDIFAPRPGSAGPLGGPGNGAGVAAASPAVKLSGIGSRGARWTTAAPMAAAGWASTSRAT
jgi:hypothetical protein